MSDEWPHPREAPLETVQFAQVKSLVAHAVALVLVLFSLVFINIESPWLSGLTFLMGWVTLIVAAGRDSVRWRSLAERLPGIEYSFPPLETVEAIDNPWEADPDE